MADAAKKRGRLEMQAAAQEHAALALKTLVNVMRTGETDKDRVSAAKEVLDRAYGKSVQAHQLEGTGGGEEETEELNERAERFTRTVAGLAVRRGKGSPLQ